MRTQIAAAALAGGMLLAACGGTPDAPVADDGTTVTLPEPAAGPAPAVPVDAASAGSPLPDLAIRRINGDGGWYNLKNALPADKPLLVWFWAPH